MTLLMAQWFYGFDTPTDFDTHNWINLSSILQIFCLDFVPFSPVGYYAVL